MDDSTPKTPATLSVALDALATAATAAGLDPQAARTEGEQLAAAVAESSPGAFVDWARETKTDEGAEAFMGAASRGRRFRSSPTTLQSQLRNSNSQHAAAYAHALADVCACAAMLGQPTAQTAGAASMAAAAQLGYADNAPAATPGIPSDLGNPGSTTGLGGAGGQGGFSGSAGVGGQGATPEQEQNFLRRAPQLLQNMLNTLQQSNAQQLRDTSLNIGAASPSVGFDLGDLDPHAPGAFDLTSGVAGHQTGNQPQPSQQTPVAPRDAADAPAGAPAPQTEAAAAPKTDATTDAEPDKGKTVEELLAELDALVGLTSVKTEIRKQAAVLRVEALRHKEGLKSPTLTRHLVFVGNPGTGKTTVARLVGGIYKALGLLSKGQLVEVDRSDLVAGYLGQTAMKTTEVCKKAEGGVLFIDEAYSLNGDQYGEESINTLVKEMEDKRDDLVVIVAGYPAPMATFIDNNPGLSSRFRTTLTFDDYSDDELVGILEGMAKGADYDLGEGCITTFRNLLGEQIRDDTFGNGRFARNCLEAAIGRHAWRLRDIEQPTLDQLKTLLPQDFRDPDDPTGPDGTVPWPPPGVLTGAHAAARPDGVPVPEDGAYVRPASDANSSDGAAREGALAQTDPKPGLGESAAQRPEDAHLELPKTPPRTATSDGDA